MHAAQLHGWSLPRRTASQWPVLPRHSKVQSGPEPAFLAPHHSAIDGWFDAGGIVDLVGFAPWEPCFLAG
jgi:hypothetical protein